MTAQSHLIGHPLSSLETPVLLVDLGKLERNIATMRRIIIEEAGIKWRPHTKAIKTPAIAHKLLLAGAHGITCAKLSEAEVMAAAGIRDILIANQVVGPTKIARLVHLLRHADIIVAVDDPEHLQALDAAARSAGTRLRVVVEVNMGINRAGVEPGEPVAELAKKAACCQGLQFVGIMGWEGQTTRISDPEEKRKAIQAAVRNLTASADLCRRAGLSVDIVSCGGTGTYWITARQPGVTEVQAGGGVFCDLRYRKDCGVEHEYALTILSTVISRPTPTRIVCDAGWKAMAYHYKYPEPVDPGDAGSLRLSAEHATLDLASPRSHPKIGDHVEFICGYSDSTVYLHDNLYGIRDGRVEVVWPILGRRKLD